MLTSKPFSTIWFGSKEFLEYQLNDLIKRNKIMFYAFIRHYAEEDEKKDHIHVHIVPDGRIETSSLTNLLTEIDVNNPLPIKPAKWESSKFGDWYLYCCHNIAYLRSKGQSRKYHYSQSDFITSNEDYFIEMIHTIDMSKINRVEIIIKAAESGESFTSLIKNGVVPIQLINQYQKAYDMLQYDMEMTITKNLLKQSENVRQNEEPIVDLGEFKNITEKRLTEFFGKDGWKKTNEE